jgi:hypothetical protein
VPASVLLAPAVPLATVSVVAMSAAPDMDYSVFLSGPMLVYPKRHADPRHVIVTAPLTDVQFCTTDNLVSSLPDKEAGTPPPPNISHGSECQTSDWQLGERACQAHVSNGPALPAVRSPPAPEPVRRGNTVPLRKDPSSGPLSRSAALQYGAKSSGTCWEICCKNRCELGPLGSIGVNPGQFRVGVDAATFAAVSAARKSAGSLSR